VSESVNTVEETMARAPAGVASVPNLALLRRIDAYLNVAPRATCEVETEPPFTLFFNMESILAFLSYARPTSPLPDDPIALDHAVERVRDAFVRRDRVCRWEFIRELFPSLPHALTSRGFPEPDINPLMVITPDRFRPETHPDVEVRAVAQESEVEAAIRVQQRGFGVEDEIMAEEFTRGVWQAIARGMRLYAAFLEGMPVAAGSHLPVSGVTELLGIATLPEFRRRGLAGVLSSALVSDAFATGCDCVFLTAGDDLARRLYARTGFEEIGTGIGVMEASQ